MDRIGRVISLDWVLDGAVGVVGPDASAGVCQTGGPGEVGTAKGCLRVSGDVDDDPDAMACSSEEAVSGGVTGSE